MAYTIYRQRIPEQQIQCILQFHICAIPTHMIWIHYTVHAHLFLVQMRANLIVPKSKMFLIWGMRLWVLILCSGLTDVNLTNLLRSMELCTV